jgi:hypothetical protein
MMVEHDTILAVLSSGIALAGLLLVFTGFLFAKAESYQTKRGDKFRRLAMYGLAPVMASLWLSWMSLDALAGSQWAQTNLIVCLRGTLLMTAAFAIVGVLAGLP